jgi:glycosyltransferase involved in cell wall biosynthesis
MNIPLVSIVLATHNGEKFLREQLDSMANQTYPCLEIIIVDDCSTDSTIDIIRFFQQKHKNIKLYQNEKVLGPVKNFERGMRLSTGEYISLCDQDDVWMPEKIEKTMAVIGHSDMAYCDSVLIDENGNSLGKRMSDIKNLSSYTDCLAFSIGNVVSGHAVVFSRRLLATALPLPREIIHDWWLAFRAVQFSEIRFTNEVLVQFRQHSDNYIGAVDVKNRKRKKESNVSRTRKIRLRMQMFSGNCAQGNLEEKLVLQKLAASYGSFSLLNNFKRMIIFFRYRKRLCATKKRSAFRTWLFCCKMFFKIV